MILLGENMTISKTSFINGQWIKPEKENWISVINPANLTEVGRVHSADTLEVDLAIEAAKVALEAWKNIGGLARAEYLKLIGRRIVELADEYAVILSQENGKSLSEAKGEILYGASYFELYAGEAQRIHGEILSSSPGSKIEVTREAIGVVAAITPWNFPQAMLARKMAAALAAGCCMVAKPDHQTPFSALLLADICQEVGLPNGVFNILTGEPDVIGEHLMKSSVVRKLSFTGSTRVGKILIEQSARNVKKLSLELGGNAPFIVFEDADLDNAVEAAMASKYRNSGQTCVCTNRFFVHESIMAEFKRKLKENLKTLKLGEGIDSETTMGPLINSNAKKKIEDLLQDASEKGAEITNVGDLPKLAGHFMSPKIVDRVSTEAKIFSEEIFGPVSVLYNFSDESEVIDLANSTEYGLAAYFFTKSISRIESVRSKLDFGMIGVNCGRVSSAWAPFGGVKESGYGKEGGRAGILEYQTEKMSMQNLRVN